MKHAKLFSLMILFWGIGLPACTSDESPSGVPGVPGGVNNSADWLIPASEVRDGGPGKDGIPALDSPQFIAASEASYLLPGDLVLGLVIGNEARAYPHKILDWHEIINEDFGGQKLSIIYCPLTGTGIGWDRVVDGKETTFGVSGLLYNTNIIPYDRETGSNWSQLLLKSVNGTLSGTSAKTTSLVETTWAVWKKMYPDSKVVSTNTGFGRNYNQYPYGDYKTNQGFILFPVAKTDGRLPAKQRVLAVISDKKIKAYNLDLFTSEVKLVADQFEGKNLIVAGNKSDNYILAFENKLNGQTMNFTPVQNNLPIIMSDQKGNQYDVMGRVVTGPDLGKSLPDVPRMMSYWFSWASFYETIELYSP